MYLAIESTVSDQQLFVLHVERNMPLFCYFWYSGCHATDLANVTWSQAILSGSIDKSRKRLIIKLTDKMVMSDDNP
jgi:hypothetical protein